MLTAISASRVNNGCQSENVYFQYVLISRAQREDLLLTLRFISNLLPFLPFIVTRTTNQKQIELNRKNSIPPEVHPATKCWPRSLWTLPTRLDRKRSGGSCTVPWSSLPVLRKIQLLRQSLLLPGKPHILLKVFSIEWALCFLSAVALFWLLRHLRGCFCCVTRWWFSYYACMGSCV